MDGPPNILNLPTRMTTAEFRRLGLPLRRSGKGKGGRRGKYNNRKTFAHGIWFDSDHEAKRYPDLKILEKAGKIRDLKRQVLFTLIEKNDRHRALRYKADYTYEEQTKEGGWELVVEDCKGYRTPHYQDKKKLMYAVHGIVIRET